MNTKGFYKSLPYGGVKIKAWVTDAKRKVELRRTSADVLSGKKADPERCMDANCSMRHAKDGTFPHPVLAVWFIKTTAYVLRAANPHRKHQFVVVRYLHNEEREIAKFDKGLRVNPEKRIVLWPARGANKIGGHRPHPVGRRNADRSEPTGRVGTPKGVNGRFLSLRQWKESKEIAGAAT